MSKGPKRMRMTRAKTPEALINKASAAGDLKTVKQLARAGTSLDARHWHDGFTPLISAAFHGNLSVTEYLLEAGADQNAIVKGDYPTTYQNATALMLASLNGHMPVVKLLVDAGAEINIHGERGPSAVGLAARSGHLEIVDYLLDKGAVLDKSVLYWPVYNGHVEIVERLIKAGADTSYHGGAWRAPLTVTACAMPHYGANPDNQIRIIKLLLQAGADLNGRDSGGQTALMEAILKRNIKTALFLVSGGADVNAKNLGNRTALHFAAGRPKEISDALIKAGADVNAVDCEGLKPTDIAELTAEPRVVSKLREIIDDAFDKSEKATRSRSRPKKRSTR